MKKTLMRYLLPAALLLVGLTLAFPASRAVVVMGVYSALEQQDSVLTQEDITLKIPGGISTKEKDWFPFVITYNADYFGAYANTPVNLTILYNFGAFDPSLGCSSFYDETSDYHGAFYGAYALRTQDKTLYGYLEDGTLDTDAMALVFEYDMNVLVLGSLGCNNPEFAYTLTGHTQKTMHGQQYDVLDAKISTQSPMHSVQGFLPAYYQYGRPKRLVSQKDFKNCDVYGRIYATALPEKGITLCFYIIAPNVDTLDTVEKTWVEKSKLRSN